MNAPAINYDALKNYKPGGGGGGSVWLKMKPSETGQPKRYTVRLIPQADGSIFYDTDIHYLANNVSGVCPRKVGQECPACDVYWGAFRKITDKGAKKALGDVRPNTRGYVNVVLRSVDKDEIPENIQEAQIWSLTYRLISMLRDEIVLNLEEGIEILHPTEGRDLVAKVVPLGSAYKVDTVSVKPTPSAVPEQVVPLDLEEHATSRILTPREVQDVVPATLGAYAEEILAAAGVDFDIPF